MTRHPKRPLLPRLMAVLALAGSNVAAASPPRPSLDLVPVEQIVDPHGRTHTRLQQRHHGIVVEGGDVVVHERPNERTTITDHRLDLDGVPTRPRIDSLTARTRALRHGSPLDPGASASLDLRVAVLDDVPVLAWRIARRGTRDGLPSHPVTYVDAATGEVLRAYDDVKTHDRPAHAAAVPEGPANPLLAIPLIASGRSAMGWRHAPGASQYDGEVALSVYRHGPRTWLEHPTFGFATVDYGSSESLGYANTWSSEAGWRGGDEMAVSVHWAAEHTFRYLQQAFDFDAAATFSAVAAWPSATGHDLVLPVGTHFGWSRSNAYWLGDGAAFGAGDGVGESAFASLDVVGHELMHGVIEHASAGLEYLYEPGAINESYADIFGALVERAVRGERPSVWLVGDDFVLPGTGRTALRYMADPTADGISPSHYDQRYLGSWDNGGVHINSGLGNLAFYLAAVGGYHPDRDVWVDGIGVDAAAEVWWYALRTRLSFRSDFHDACDAMVREAEALHGGGSDVASTIADAWRAVGVVCRVEDPCADADASIIRASLGTPDEVVVVEVSGAHSGRHAARLRGPEGTDLDLALFRHDALVAEWVEVDAATTSSTEESLTWPADPSETLPVGPYRWQVSSADTDVGTFDLCVIDRGATSLP